MFYLKMLFGISFLISYGIFLYDCLRKPLVIDNKIDTNVTTRYDMCGMFGSICFIIFTCICCI